MKSILLCLLLASPVFAQNHTEVTLEDNQTITGQKTFNQLIPKSYTVATLPVASAVTGITVVVTDAATAGSCTVGGGSALSFCRSNGSSWTGLGDGGGGNIAQTSFNVAGPAYGGKPDGSTDNAAAITAVFAASNAVTQGTPVVYFPCVPGTGCQYNINAGAGTSPFHPTIPTTIHCDEGVTINFTSGSTAHAMDIGPSGLLAATYQTDPYTIDGCKFIGGANLTQGIYFNTFLVQTNVRRNFFYNFGSTSATFFALDYNSDDWDNEVTSNRKVDNDGSERNWLKSENLTDLAISMFRIENNGMYCLTSLHSQTACSGGSIGIWLHDHGSIITGNKLQFHGPVIRLGPGCDDCKVVLNYFEGPWTTANGPLVQYGDPGDAPATVIHGVIVKDNHMNIAAGTSLSFLWAAATGNDTCAACSVDPGYDIHGVLPALVTDAATYANFGAVILYNSLISTPSTNWGIYMDNTGITALNGSGSGRTELGFGGTNFWELLSAGHLLASTDNQNDIGQPGATRPRSLYVSNSLNVEDPGTFGSKQTQTSAACQASYATLTLATGATTTDTTLNCLPANAIIDAVVYRITTTITTAASFTIGDATTAARFCGTQSTLTAGTTGTCFVQADQTGAAGPRQTSAAKVRVTTNVNPGAGAIRLIVYYHTWTAPTS